MNPAPQWLMTYADMSNLLMIFFIMLVSAMSVDRSRYARLEQALAEKPHPGAAPAESDASRAFRELLERPEARAQGYPAPGVYAEVVRRTEGDVITIGGEAGGFPEAGWTLNDRQKEMLVEVKRRLRGRRNIVEIRGHADAHVRDSLVMEPDGRVRPFSTDDLQRPERMELADHSLLSWRRASEVKRFFAREHPELGDDAQFPEEQLRVRADSYTRRADPFDRALNRRIEILASSELVER
jgi:flagellar motor protein MotB